MASLPNAEEQQDAKRKASSRWTGQPPGTWRTERDAAREAAKEENAAPEDAARAALASLLRQLRSLLDEVAVSYGAAYSSQQESLYQDLRRSLFRCLEGVPAARDDAARIYPELLASVAGISFENMHWDGAGREAAIRFENLIDDFFAKKPANAVAGDAVDPDSSARRSRGRPRGGERSPEYYREHLLDLRDRLDRRPKQHEFLRYLALIRPCEKENRPRPSPRDIRECVTNPDAPKFERGTLKSNLKPKYWPWETFVAWAVDGTES